MRVTAWKVPVPARFQYACPSSRHFERGVFASFATLSTPSYCLALTRSVPTDTKIRYGMTAILVKIGNSHTNGPFRRDIIGNLALFDAVLDIQSAAEGALDLFGASLHHCLDLRGWGF